MQEYRRCPYVRWYAQQTLIRHISYVRHIVRSIRVILAVSVLGFLLASCGVLDKDITYKCPTVFILDDAKTLTKFKLGSGRDITDIMFEAEIVHFAGDCDYEEGEAEIQLSIQIRIARGPANKDRQVAFDYFTAIPQFQPQAEGKSVFNVTGEFVGNDNRMLYQDDLDMTIPVKVPTDGAALEVVLGFQLTPEELKYNRSRTLR